MLHLEPILAFEDNYIWAVHDGAHALLVDPGEAEPILAWVAKRRLCPVAMLVTHHHHDHCGGLAAVLLRHPMPVYGPARDDIAGVDHRLAEGDRVNVPALDLDFAVLEIPGHTLGHLAYHGHGWLFSGDTLFSCGCGRVFESTPAALHASLRRLSTLPADTLVCAAHEYTLNNIRFALGVDPDNPALQAWQLASTALRQAGRPTLPVRLGEELTRNPFLRCHDPNLRVALERQAGHPLPPDAADLFAELRRRKDVY